MSEIMHWLPGWTHRIFCGTAVSINRASHDQGKVNCQRCISMMKLHGHWNHDEEA